jgi:co-chaperonin GroES (HSP10)
MNPQKPQETHSEPDYYIRQSQTIKAENKKKSYFARMEKEHMLREKDNWANIKDEYMIQPIFGGDGRVLVKVDGHKSKYDCTACNGKGHTELPCGRCQGKKVSFNGISEVPCPTCSVGESDGRKTYGFQLCEQCKGRGGTIIIPDTSQRNTDSGDVLAISTVGITIIKPGMKVLLATYSGVPFKFMDIDFKIMIEKDILGIIIQLKKVADGMHQDSYADMENLGVARED